MNDLATIKKNGQLTTQKTNAISNFPSLSSWFDDVSFGDFPALFRSNFNTGISLPKVNIKEEPDAYVVEMAVPGLKKSDFNINLDAHTLSISAGLEENTEKKDDNYTRREFGYSAFKRTFTLPETVNDKKIDATYNEGILILHLPKKEEAKQSPPRSIKVS